MLFHDSLNGVARALRCRHFYADGVTLSTPGSFYPSATNDNKNIYERSDGFNPPFEGDFYIITGRYQGAFSEVLGTTDIHATARLAIQSFGRFNNQDWLAESPWRGGLNRICCVHSFRAETVAFALDGLSDYDEVAGNLFKQKRSARSGIILCAAREDKALRAPWVMAGVSGLGHANNSAAQYAVDASLPFLGRRTFSGNSGFSSSAGLLTLDHYPTAEHCVLTFLAAERFSSDDSATAVKLAIVYDTNANKHFSVVVAGSLRNVFYLVGNEFVSQFCLPSPNWSAGQRSIAVSFFLFATLAAELTAEIAGRNDAGGTNAVNRFNLLLGGVDNVAPSAMVAASAPLDFADTCVRSFYSTSIQRLLSGDASFQHPNYAFLNCEGALGLGAASARLGIQELVANTEERGYIAPDESLVHDRLSYVELKSSRHWMPQQPFDDEDVTFPIVTTQGQATFRFRGTSITGTGLEFVPWSSNAFADPIESYGPTNQAVQVTPSSPAPQWFSASTGTPPSDESGTWYYGMPVNGINIFAPGGAVIEANDAGTPSNSSTRLYNTISTVLPRFDQEARSLYPPNVAFDEQSYMTGVMTAACPRAYSFGRLQESAQAPSLFGYSASQFDDRHPAAWPLSGRTRSLIYIDGSNTSSVAWAISRSFMPSLAGKEFVCTRETVAGFHCQAGLFHCLVPGVSFSKTGTRHVSGEKQTETISGVQAVEQIPGSPSSIVIQYKRTVALTGWTGKIEHACTFNTKTVELFIKWSAALQSPGPYKVTPPHEVNTQGLSYSRAPSRVAPAMWVKSEDVANVTPILVAEVWARAVGEVDVSSTYTFPDVFGTSGTYKHKVAAATASTFANNQPPVSIDLADSVVGHQRTFDKNALVSPQAMDMRYLGAFPFNRAQTQRLLDGETVEPTYWFLDDEGTALESQPVTVPWHNETFGTYKLKFRLVTE